MGFGDELDQPLTGDLAVRNVINPPRSPYFFPVKNAIQGKRLIDALASAELLSSAIEVNAFGLVEWDGEEWTEWESKETGEQIDEWEPIHARSARQ
jgi:hypothetical protein